MTPLVRKKFIESVVKELRSSNVRGSDADWYIGFNSETPVEESEYDPKTGKVINNTEIGDHATFMQQWDADNVGFLESKRPIKLTDLLKEIEEGEMTEGRLKDLAVATAFSLAGLVGKGQDTKGPIRMNIGPSFASGYHSIEKLPAKDVQNISNQFKKLTADIVANPKADFDFTITSGESQVTNKDAEAGNKRLNPRELGDMRSASAKEFVEYFIKGLKDKGIFKGNYTIKIAPTVVGSTPYKQGINKASDTSYTKEQFVTVDAVARPTTIPQYITASDDMRVFDQNKHVIADFYKKVRAAKDFESGNLGINPNDYYAVRFVNDKTGQYEPGTYLVNKGDYNITSGLLIGADRENIEKLKKLPGTVKIDQSL